LLPPARPTRRHSTTTSGEYELPIGILVLTHEGDKLFGEPKGDTRKSCSHKMTAVSWSPNVNAKIKFIRDEKSKVIEIVVNLHDQEMKGKKIK